MKLRRIEANAFGLLHDTVLGDLGDGLTIIVGPNESGKTTYRALVRQVLYGFPDGRRAEKSYKPLSGTRSGRLVFDDGTGVWGIGRSGDKGGGTLKVETIAGNERPQFLAEVIGPITEQTYRVVFGFGLEELAAIESGQDKDVVAHLYGEAMASGKNLVKVKGDLAASASAILTPRGKGTLDASAAEMKQLRTEIAGLVSAEREFTGDQTRLKQLAERLEAARSDCDQAEQRYRLLARDAERARSIATALLDLEQQAAEQAAIAREFEAQAKRLVVDERLLSIAPEMTALLDEASRAREWAERARKMDEAAEEHLRKAESFKVPGDIQGNAGDKARLETWRSDQAALVAEAQAAERAAENARNHAAGLRKAAADAGAESTSPRPAQRPLAWALLALGAAGVALGVWLGQWVASAVSAAVAVAAIMLFAAGRPGSARSCSDEALRADADAERERLRAESAHDRLDAAQALWESWLDERGLTARGTDVASVQALLDDLAKRDEQVMHAASRRAEAGAERAAAAKWRDALVELVRGPLGIAEKDPEPQALAIRAREALKNVQETRDKRDSALKDADVAQAQAATLTRKVEQLKSQIAEMAKEHRTEGDLLAALETAEAGAAARLAEAKTALDEATVEHATLAAKLDVEGHDATITLKRQRLEGLLAMAQGQADAYLVDALALQLVNKATERYERDRQPQVMKVAEDLLAEMTAGRYEGVKVPFGMTEVQVITCGQEVRTTAELSGGTAEQLYLALRVGLISSFGEQAPNLPVLMDDIMANYDEERVAGAVSAIRALAARRQVLFFTCHPDTAQALADNVDGSTVIELERCVLKGL